MNYVDGTHGALTKVENHHAAHALAQGHPKCVGCPRPGMALDANTAVEGGDSEVGQPGIGVGGAVAIGAFQS
jgi:hypothetical protein